MPGPLLKINDLTVSVTEQGASRDLVQNLSLEVPNDSIVALVGGSGSGKTTTGLAILGLLPEALRVRSGKILFEGKDLLTSSSEELRRLRGKDIAMIFQEPLNAFNPVFRIGSQIEEVLIIHTQLASPERQKRIHELLHMVEIPDPERVARSYPHQLSGGMRQRAMIAQAIAAGPKLIIADEPTSNLDVTLQARVIELFRRLRKELKLSILLITHDLGMVEHLADKVVVLAQGRVVESGLTSEVLRNPKHPFTIKLMDALAV